MQTDAVEVVFLALRGIRPRPSGRNKFTNGHDFSHGVAPLDAALGSSRPPGGKNHYLPEIAVNARADGLHHVGRMKHSVVIDRRHLRRTGRRARTGPRHRFTRNGLILGPTQSLFDLAKKEVALPSHVIKMSSF